jgi:DNA-binding response OmpR family regulator
VSQHGRLRVVLVVEDDWAVRNLIGIELRSAGCLEAGHRIDVVFTVTQLPSRLSGWEVAEQFRAVRPDVPIIYASGNSVNRSRAVAGSLFFEKPYRPADLVEACRRLVQRKYMMRLASA